MCPTLIGQNKLLTNMCMCGEIKTRKRGENDSDSGRDLNLQFGKWYLLTCTSYRNQKVSHVSYFDWATVTKFIIAVQVWKVG